MTEPAVVLASRIRDQRRAYEAVLRLRKAGRVVERAGDRHKVRLPAVCPGYALLLTTRELIELARGT